MKKILFVDAGHGGIDSLGRYTTPAKNGKRFEHKGENFHNGGWFYEGVWNRSFAQKFIEKATAAGFHCVPVYDPVIDTRLGVRVETANDYWKNVTGAGVYLSFHSNAFRSTNRGFNVFYHPNSRTGKQIASAIAEPINDLFIQSGSVNNNPLREGWINKAKNQIYYVLEATVMPAVLFEFGFFDNLEDARLIFDDCFQKQLAEKVVVSLNNIL